MLKHLRRAWCWAAGEIWEKVNIFETWRELKKLLKSQGPRFFVFAVVWELFEDVVIPIILWNVGLPELIPIVLLLHGEPIVYPIAIFGFRTYDRCRGRVPWEPDRSAMSTGYRTAAKMLLYRTLALGVFSLVLWKLGLSLWLLTGYSVMMTFFSLVHERLWHDSNFGITEDDQVETKRSAAKALTYRTTSAVVMLGVFTALLGSVPWVPVLAYQITMLGGYFALETFWAKNTWGIRSTLPVERKDS